MKAVDSVSVVVRKQAVFVAVEEENGQTGKACAPRTVRELQLEVMLAAGASTADTTSHLVIWKKVSTSPRNLKPKSKRPAMPVSQYQSQFPS